MAQFRVSFLFGYGGAGWTENWYRQADTPRDAANITDFHWQAYIAPRADGLTLRGIRSNQVGSPRISYLRIMNKTVASPPGGPALGGEPPSVSLQCQVQCADFRKRVAQFRGLSDTDIERSPQGNPIFNAALLGDIAQLKLALIGFGAQVQALRSDPIGNPFRAITQFAKGGGTAQTTAIQHDGPEIPPGSRVLISGVSRRLFPGFQGPIPIIASAAGSVILPVLWRQPADTLPGNGAKIRVVQYDYPLVQDLVGEDVRTRKVGRPLLGYRGRRSGQRFRSA